MLVVYFSSISNNTQRFVDKLNTDNKRIPLYRIDPELIISEPYVLITPTYGAGTSKGAVPKQVIKFLNNAQNRSLIKGVVPMGNTNFGLGYCLAGNIISQKTGVPVLGQVELFGTPEDVEEIRMKIKELGASI